MTAAELPWDARRHELGVASRDVSQLILAPLPVVAAEELAAQFAALDPWAAYGYPASSLAAYLAHVEAGAPRFAIYSRSAIVGVAGLRLAWLKGPYLQFLGVLPGHQGKGIGQSVLAWLDEEARAGLGPNIWVCVSEINTGALALYERHGFARVTALEDLVRDGRTEILLRKRMS